MTEIDEQLLKQFFQSARNQKIADDGFTKRVAGRLPDRAARQSNWWTCCCVAAGIVLFVVCRGWEPLLADLGSLLRMLIGSVHPVAFFISLGVVSCLALLELVNRLEHQQV